MTLLFIFMIVRFLDIAPVIHERSLKIHRVSVCLWLCVDGGWGHFSVRLDERGHFHLMIAVIGNRCFVTPSVNTRLNKHAYFCPKLTRRATTHEFDSFLVLRSTVKAPFKRQSPVFKTACLTYFLLSPFLQNSAVVIMPIRRRLRRKQLPTDTSGRRRGFVSNVT